MPEALQERLPTFKRVLTARENDEEARKALQCAHALQEVLVGCLKLSAAQRWSTGEVLARLNKVPASGSEATDGSV